MNSKKKKVIIIGTTITILLIISIGFSYAIFSERIVGNRKYSFNSGDLNVVIDESRTLNDVLQESSIPISDYSGKKLEPFRFSIVNNERSAISYSLYIVEDDIENRMPSNNLKYYLTRDFENKKNLDYLDETDSREKKLIDSVTIPSGATFNYELRMWIASTANSDIMGLSYSCHIEVDTTQVIEEESKIYVENILDGNDPVLKNELVPVKISETGVVTKADLKEEWYNYENNMWANAVILKDKNIQYEDGQLIPGYQIESYFVWIPKFDYQIFNMGEYTALGTLTDATQVINVRFKSDNTINSATECTYPIENNQAVAGESGTCSIGKWMTHPAFTTMNVKGFWVGKFETGYDGATTTALAQSDTVDTSKIIIKPNVYSWRNITVGKMFQNSYEYNRQLDSHMMKNTEWGAMAYLSASKYGYKDEISEENPRTTAIINNNSGYVTGYASTEEPTKGYYTSSTTGNRQENIVPGYDGTYTKNYLNTYSQLASTTGNYSGIYDTSGGAWEYVAGYTTGAASGKDLSGITSLYSGFYTNSNYAKYWDKYTTAATNNYTYNNRILGDGTAEFGPFQATKDPDGSSRNKSSWNNDYANFVYSSNPWFRRGSYFANGIGAGSFVFSNDSGAVNAGHSYRIVLSPKEVA